MKVLVMTNGGYGNLDWYKERKDGFEKVICVDGGAGWAKKLGITPDWAVGDMDSIDQEDRMYMEREGVRFFCHPSQKDPTDTQIALQLAEQLGAEQITIWGGTGSRLDHTLSNLFSAAKFALGGGVAQFDSPMLAIYLVKDMLKLSGQIGKTVSVLAIGGGASGVTLKGFQYPLENAEVDSLWQYGISNIITDSQQVVSVASGILAVFYYRELP